MDKSGPSTLFGYRLSTVRFSIDKPEPGTYDVAEVLVEGDGPIVTPLPPIP